MQYDFEIIYRHGSANMEADCLSRNPVLPCDQLNHLTVNFLTNEEILDSQSRFPTSTNNSRTNCFLTRTIKSKVKILLDLYGGLDLVKYFIYIMGI